MQNSALNAFTVLRGLRQPNEALRRPLYSSHVEELRSGSKVFSLIVPRLFLSPCKEVQVTLYRCFSTQSMIIYFLTNFPLTGSL